MSSTLSKWKPIGKARNTSALLHPFSGFMVIFLDNVLFGANMLTLGLATSASMIIGFSVAFVLVFLFQRFLDADATPSSIVKAIFAGIVTGIPTSIAGTVFGSLILFWSGIDLLFRRRS